MSVSQTSRILTSPSRGTRGLRRRPEERRRRDQVPHPLNSRSEVGFFSGGHPLPRHPQRRSRDSTASTRRRCCTGRPGPVLKEQAVSVAEAFRDVLQRGEDLSPDWTVLHGGPSLRHHAAYEHVRARPEPAVGAKSTGVVVPPTGLASAKARRSPQLHPLHPWRPLPARPLPGRAGRGGTSTRSSTSPRRSGHFMPKVIYGYAVEHAAPLGSSSTGWTGSSAAPRQLPAHALQPRHERHRRHGRQERGHRTISAAVDGD